MIHVHVHVFFSEPFTGFTELRGGLLGNALSYVYLSTKTGHAHVGRVRLDKSPTLTTKATRKKKVSGGETY